MVVIDASVVSKWYLNEASSVQAKDAYKQLEGFFAPSLIITEVLSAIIKAGRINNFENTHTKFLCQYSGQN